MGDRLPYGHSITTYTITMPSDIDMTSDDDLTELNDAEMEEFERERRARDGSEADSGPTDTEPTPTHPLFKKKRAVRAYERATDV